MPKVAPNSRGRAERMKFMFLVSDGMIRGKPGVGH